jgi:hypothetical protein
MIDSYWAIRHMRCIDGLSLIGPVKLDCSVDRSASGVGRWSLAARELAVDLPRQILQNPRICRCARALVH